MAVKRQSTLFDFAKEAGPSIVASKHRKSAEESSASTNNAITVEKPSGSTTIIINNNCSASELNSKPLTTGQHIDTIDVQSDISEPSAQLCDVARSPNTPPVQPIDLVFPIQIQSVVTNSGVSIQNGLRVTSGLNIQQ